MPIVPSDIFLAVIRIVIITSVMIIFFSMFAGFKVIVKTADAEEMAFELGEAFISSRFSVERGIIDAAELPDWPRELNYLNDPAIDPAIKKRAMLTLLSNPREEPIRHCKVAVGYFIYDFEGHGISAMGMLAKPEEEEGWETSMIRFPIWIASENRLTPARLEVRTYVSPLTRITCAIEQAWINGESQIVAECPQEKEWLTVDCDLMSEEGKICIENRCRVMGIGIEPGTVDYDDGAKLKFTREGDKVRAEVV